ncbi:hypothetical protein KUV57_11300 [Epibacterium sp. DP7N7-1]|nr:hypothetical protein [Epibacterium sp. DP7N7-1]
MRFFSVVFQELRQICDNFRSEYTSLILKTKKWRRQQRQNVANAERVSTCIPDTTKYKYTISWYCGDCDRYNQIFIDKFASAIQSEQDQFKRRCCAYCGGKATEDYSSSEQAELDDDIIEFWMQNEAAYFWPQDEDLLIAHLPSDIILKLLKRCDASGYPKGAFLIEALLVRFLEEPCHPSERKALLDWISGNQHVWDQPSFWEYLRDDVKRMMRQ